MSTFKTSVSLIALSAIALTGAAISSKTANAAGFYIQEQSVSGLGSAFSGSVTNLKDASTVYFNPAGMTKLEGIHTQAAAHLIIPSADLTNTGSTQNIALGGGAISGNDGGNPYDPTPVPNAFATYQVDDQFWLGLGISAPFGLANEYDDGWFGRYDSIETELLTIDIQPSIAYKASDSLSIGFGVNLQYADAKLTNAVSDTAEGIGTLEGDDWSLGFTAGLQYQPTDMTTIGLSYRSDIRHTLQGRTGVDGTDNNDFSVSGRADLHLPDVATFGVTQGINDRFRLMGQATWFGWENFADITTLVDDSFTTAGGNSRAAGTVLSNIVQDYDDTWAFAVGAEYDYSDEWTLRGGFQFDATPTNDQFRTTRTPDGDRTWIAGGATYDWSDRLSIDLAATYIFIDDETVNVTRNNTFSAVTATTVSADTEGDVGIIAVGLNYKF